MAQSCIQPLVIDPKRVLVVDDDGFLLRAMARALTRIGAEVATAGSAEQALERAEGFDLIVCDDGLPGMRGSALLEVIRARGDRTPFILMTGTPTVDAMLSAFDGGATSFLPKPFRMDDALRRIQLALEDVDAPATSRRMRAERCRQHEALDRALAGLQVAFQPIVSLRERKVFGYEALMRSSEPALPHPGAVLHAAEQLQRIHDVGRRVRELVAAQLACGGTDAFLFVNLHAYDLSDDDLYRRDSPLSPFADRVVLEITERADLGQLPDANARLDALRAMGFRIAVDDLGAGYAGLTSLVELDPDVVKLDMGLIRDVDTNARKRRIVGSLLNLFAELDRRVVSEGVETAAELQVLRDLGCDLVQGYLLARPGPAFPEVRW